MKIADSFLVSKIHDCGRPLTEGDIAAFERKHGIQLPGDYRQFLLLRNGGRFYEPVGYTLPTDKYCDSTGNFRFFRMLQPPDDFESDFEEQLNVHRGRLAPGAFPIADAAGDLLVLDLESAICGVKLWVRDWEMGRPPIENQVPLAGTFSEFAAGCRIEPASLSNFETQEPFKAVEHFRFSSLQEFLARGLAIDATNEHGETLLYCACKCLNYDAAELLLQRGANPNKPGSRWSFSPLYLAASAGAIDLIKLLISHRAHGHMPLDPATKVFNALYPPPAPRVAALLRGIA